MLDESVEERLIKWIAFRVILDGEGEGVTAEMCLLDDVVARAPSFDFKAGTELGECLMMGAVHQRKLNGRAGSIT